MQNLRYWLINLICTLLRAFPLPTRTGLRTIGKPGREAPVFLTGNFLLTVERVKRALRGIDCYLLVADSRGINVWCGAAGGYLTNHSVISVIKTSGIEQQVNHRKIILPQLAASGIETREVTHRSGWHVVWGPVYAADIPAFMENQQKKNGGMHQVAFPLIQRLEMALMWAFPFSLIVSLLTYFISPESLGPLNGLIWGLSLLIFICFPLYDRWFLRNKDSLKISRFTIVFDLGKSMLFFSGLALLAAALYLLLAPQPDWNLLWRWGLYALVIVLLLSLDLLGSTPMYKSGLHEDRFLKVILNREKCCTAGFCRQVCLRDCFEVDKARGITTIPRGEACVKCGACIVQCPFDALTFQHPDGRTISPQLIRTHKLNLLGTR
ncbi:MAG: hypothetical protein Kow0042_23600 [Calditrichia bacterium]